VSGNLGKYGINTSTDYVKSLLYPNVYKQSYGTYESITGKPQNIKAKFNEGILKYTFQRLVSDVPFLEDVEGANEGEMFDVLGYPTVRKLQDVNPIASLLWIEDYDTKMRSQNKYETHKYINKRGVSISFPNPRSYKGKELDTRERSVIAKYVSDKINDYIEERMDYLDSKTKKEVQSILDEKKAKYVEEAKRKLLK
jgi:hypothetical protein